MPTLKYRHKEYNCEYLDWYKKSLHHKLTRPNCVMRHQNVFTSSLKNFTNCVPVLGLNLSTSVYGNYSKTMQLQLDASVQMDKVMMILPMGIYYSKLMFFHAARKILDTSDVVMLVPGVEGHLVEKTRFNFWHMHIDHISLTGTNEILMLLSPKSIVITDTLYDDRNTKVGKDSYELHFDTANVAMPSS